MVGVRSLWRSNGREGKSREWPVGIMCVCVRGVGGVHACVCVCVTD